MLFQMPGESYYIRETEPGWSNRQSTQSSIAYATQEAWWSTQIKRIKQIEQNKKITTPKK